ncbi:hypothetical protein MB901379_02958 [Mycobacterium basiliense]|uniref:Uncharacterized protein n=1 Tax=Mycobacterium basiliense TaxID=2094119 RepID=A0A447GFY4_9MYCO|nr:hypothetical protein MB901379_02958 [Mycobacterium basiliense]
MHTLVLDGINSDASRWAGDAIATAHCRRQRGAKHRLRRRTGPWSTATMDAHHGCKDGKGGLVSHALPEKIEDVLATVSDFGSARVRYAHRSGRP